MTDPDTRKASGGHQPLVNPDGTLNVVRIDPARRRLGRDLYHFLQTGSWLRLFATIAVLYLGSNVVFALVYYVTGAHIAHADPSSFLDAFFFSVQTMSTIGGGMTAAGPLANTITVIEALCGLLITALATGLVFAKFSRPHARVRFSRVAVVGRNKQGQPTLMFRMANIRSNQIIEARCNVALLIDEPDRGGGVARRFHDLTLTRGRSPIFAATWTAFHPIDAHSPLFGATAESLRAGNGTLLVTLAGLDDTLGQTVHTRYAYNSNTIIWNARLVDILGTLPDGRRSVDYTRFHDWVPDPPPPSDPDADDSAGRSDTPAAAPVSS